MVAQTRGGVIEHRRLERPLLVLGTIVAGMLAVAGGVEAGIVTADGHGLILACVIPLLVPIVLWRFEEAGVLLLVAAAALVEQFPVVLGPDQLTDGTSRIPLFTSLSAGAGATGLAFNPAELLIALVVVLWILRSALAHDVRLPRSTTARTLWAMLGIVALGFVVGIAHGGDPRIALVEVRPWVYLAIAFVLGARLLRTPRAIDGLLWVLVLCAGVKAAQGVYLLFATHSLQPAPEALLAHEESLFFGIDLVITLGLWLFGIRGRLRITATALLPLVALAEVGNHRRAAWVIAGAGVAIMLAIAYLRLPERRRAIRALLAMGVVAGAVYLPLFWNDQGNLGQPARAVRSLVDPSARDQGSDQYRQLEDANLGINIHASAPFGAGFGVPINYVVPIVDISQTDSLIRYIPHDGVLYVWMRLGWQGILAFWALIAAAIFSALRLTTAREPRIAMLGAVVASTVVGYVILGYEDLGLYWYRVALIVGVILGTAEAASALALEEEKEPAPLTAGAAPRLRIGVVHPRRRRPSSAYPGGL